MKFFTTGKMNLRSLKIILAIITKYSAYINTAENSQFNIIYKKLNYNLMYKNDRLTMDKIFIFSNESGIND